MEEQALFARGCRCSPAASRSRGGSGVRRVHRRLGVARGEEPGGGARRTTANRGSRCSRPSVSTPASARRNAAKWRRWPARHAGYFSPGLMEGRWRASPDVDPGLTLFLAHELEKHPPGARLARAGAATSSVNFGSPGVRSGACGRGRSRSRASWLDHVGSRARAARDRLVASGRGTRCRRARRGEQQRTTSWRASTRPRAPRLSRPGPERTSARSNGLCAF